MTSVESELEYIYFAFFGNIVAAVSLYSSSLSSSIFMTITQAVISVISWVFSGSVAARNIDYNWHNHCLSFISLEYNLYLPRLSNCATKLEPVKKASGCFKTCLLICLPPCQCSSGAVTALGWEGISQPSTCEYQQSRGFFICGDSKGCTCCLARVIASLNLINIISYYIPGRIQGNLSSLIGCLSVTLMSRMMLDLHEAADSGIYTVHGSTYNNNEDHVLTRDVWVHPYEI
ncbi:hypothetical protein EV360DRAFT_74231 [Lentinula raphanica]|nr:hypothetical protein EV360DRAFT_74231 [Lentinula raphanica]